MLKKQYRRREFLKTVGGGVVGMAGLRSTRADASAVTRPNILFCYADDQSWLHTSIAGDPVVKTPNFDRVAREGVLFNNAFCAAPSCTPSRSTILTGQEMWRLQEGGLLFGALPRKFELFPGILERAGYHVGYTGKGYEPANLEAPGCWRDPTGTGYFGPRMKTPGGIANVDYAGNLDLFLDARPERHPFFFWVGFYEPHREYEQGIGLKSGMNIDDVRVPSFLPDVPEIRSDILDYLYEIQWNDRHLGRMFEMLEERGELDNTIVVVTSDNGMPFPRAKTTLYDHGTHMPLAIRWGDRVKPGRVVDDLVSLTDLAPTFLEAAGLPKLPAMTGRSLMNVLVSDEAGQIDPVRDRVFTGIERHTPCRTGGLPYPSRAIRTHQWLYIRNFEPDRWPAGDPPPFKPLFYDSYGDIDECPTIAYMLKHKDDAHVRKLLDLAIAKRPAEELYDVKRDPDQIHNLAGDPAYSDTVANLRGRLLEYLQQTDDPRMRGESPWDNYPFYLDEEDISHRFRRKANESDSTVT